MINLFVTATSYLKVSFICSSVQLIGREWT